MDNFDCPKCKELGIQYRISSPNELRHAIVVIRSAIDAGVLSETSHMDAKKEGWRTQFASLESGPPDDLVLCYFACNSCNQHFCLSCETYHGSGGSWSLIANV